ncbi:MarR family transcriptional regulator [Paracoccus yeei]|jgi:DNA-binding MarR family transcriptional regulator|uniref:MarR family transcriptional regulator n=1 Tax=Paracoccus yeei TaxID=147645 RepID=A0A386UHV0_9RHOB|nr:MarR family transcriptional regulator [Paracoccus yeei]AYF00141.1 MarR family transcriptional regulator [Paracoccus yeei]
MRIEGFLPYRLAVVAEALSRQLGAVYGGEHGLTREEWRLLFLIEDAGRIDSLQLAGRTSLDKVQVSRAASRLEDKGLILRRIPAGDRRLREYAITEAGQALFREVFGAVEARAGAIFMAMPSEDRAALEKGIGALGEAIRQIGDPAR